MNKGLSSPLFYFRTSENAIVMKSTLFFMTFSIAIMLIGSCGKEEEEVVEPTACIDIPDTGIVIGNGLPLKSCSDSTESVEWDFGDGNSSNSPILSHTYAEAGVYTVTLTATSRTGHTSSASIQVTVGYPYIKTFRVLQINTYGRNESLPNYNLSIGMSNYKGNDYTFGFKGTYEDDESLPKDFTVNKHLKYPLTTDQWEMTAAVTWDASPQPISGGGGFVVPNSVGSDGSYTVQLGQAVVLSIIPEIDPQIP